MNLRFWDRDHRIIHLLVLFLAILTFVTVVSAESASYWIDASKSLGNAGRWNESLDAAEKATAIEPDNAKTWNIKAAALLNLNRYQESLDAAERSVSLNPDFISPWLIKGAAFLSLGRNQDALSASEKAIALDPNNYIGWNNKAIALLKLNRYQEALDAAERSVSLNQNFVKSWENKGYALQGLGRYQEALAAYDKALSLDPDYEQAINRKQIILSYLLSNSTNQSNPSVPTATSVPPTQPVIAAAPQQQQDAWPFLLLLLIVMVAIFTGGGTYGYIRYRQKKPVAVSSPPVREPVVTSKKYHHDVFISYAQVDKSTADAACAILESRNIRCWIAPRDVPPGINFPEGIVEGIEGSRVMVLIFSSHSNKSQHVIRELTTAVNKGLIIIPFRIENVEPTKSMGYLIGLPHWLDAITPPLEHHLDTLAGTIEKFLSNDTSGSGEEK
jgi:tetratricopeptide (TPR) repeat protein